MHLDFDDKYIVLRTNPSTFLPDSEEPDHFIHRWSGDVVLTDEGNQGDKIGEFSLLYVDATSALIEGTSYFDVFDTDSSTISYFEDLYADGGSFTQRVYEIVGDEFWNPNLLILDRLTIEPAHRGKQIGLVAILGMINRFRAGARIVALKAYPLQHEVKPRSESGRDERQRLKLDDFEQGKRKSKKALKDYYARLGFKTVPRTEFMILDAERPLTRL